MSIATQLTELCYMLYVNIICLVIYAVCLFICAAYFWYQFLKCVTYPTLYCLIRV
jgi:hypothetical protein